jgi:hypothetical protein
MATVFTVRIPDALKREMERFDEGINWSEEVRRLLEKRVRQLANLRSREIFEEVAQGRPPVPRGTAARLIREDRDAH